MNYTKLDLFFQNNTEIEVARLLTCDFDLASFSNIAPHINDESFVELLKHTIRFKTHLNLEPTTYEAFKNKIWSLVENTNQVFEGNATRVVGYAGLHLRDSKTLVDFSNPLVSYNEYDYVFNYFPWMLKSINPVFQEHLNLYPEKQEFLYLPSFDLSILDKLEDVKQIKGGKLIMKDGSKFNMVLIEE